RFLGLQLLHRLG
ncbi:hypothetical protein D046_0763C, partial [Vibrio parahaemolyticus V-223/04]